MLGAGGCIVGCRAYDTYQRAVRGRASRGRGRGRGRAGETPRGRVVDSADEPTGAVCFAAALGGLS